MVPAKMERKSKEVDFDLPTGPGISLDLGNANVDLLYLLDDDNTAALS